MPLSPNEIRLLNELARRTAEEDPDYVRRLMTHTGLRREGRGRRASRSPFSLSGVREILYALPVLPRVFLPLLLVGAVLVGGVAGASYVAMNSGEVAHVRPDGPNARLQP